MIYFRLYYKVLGGHTHVRIFSGKNPKGAFGKNGDMIFRNEEWEDFLKKINNVEILREDRETGGKDETGLL